MCVCVCVCVCVRVSEVKGGEQLLKEQMLRGLKFVPSLVFASATVYYVCRHLIRLSEVIEKRMDGF